jgi:hypothetical protein
VEEIERRKEKGQCQWGREKKRTKRWAFNFPPDIESDEEERNDEK